jgi:hypothetical protein
VRWWRMRSSPLVETNAPGRAAIGCRRHHQEEAERGGGLSLDPRGGEHRGGCRGPLLDATVRTNCGEEEGRC